MFSELSIMLYTEVVVVVVEVLTLITRTVISVRRSLCKVSAFVQF